MESVIKEVRYTSGHSFVAVMSVVVMAVMMVYGDNDVNNINLILACQVLS